jgi:hypothetical protein
VGALRGALLRALVFLVLIGVPAVVFDWVYWRAPLPQSLIMPIDASFRLTAACFVAALVELLYPRALGPLLAYVAAFATYGLGFVESAYLKGVVVSLEPTGGTAALAELATSGWERPRYYLILLAIVSTPYAATCFGRQRKLSLARVSALSATITFVVASALVEPFRVEVGRRIGAYVCVRTLLVALLLPLVAQLAERRAAPRPVQ